MGKTAGELKVCRNSGQSRQSSRGMAIKPAPPQSAQPGADRHRHSRCSQKLRWMNSPWPQWKHLMPTWSKVMHERLHTLQMPARPIVNLSRLPMGGRVGLGHLTPRERADHAEQPHGNSGSLHPPSMDRTCQMKWNRAHLFSALVLLPLGAIAQTGRTPTDIDLKAGYCLAAERTQLENIQAASAANSAASANEEARKVMVEVNKQLSDDIERLAAYINPKLALLNGPILISAADRGIADVAAAQAETRACREGSKANLQGFSECLQQGPAATRLRSCQGATFLPF